MIAMTVKMRTEKTKIEKQRLLMSLIMFWAMGSVLMVFVLEFEFESFIFLGLVLRSEIGNVIVVSGERVLLVMMVRVDLIVNLVGRCIHRASHLVYCRDSRLPSCKKSRGSLHIYSIVNISSPSSFFF